MPDVGCGDGDAAFALVERAAQDPVWVTRRLCLPAAGVPEVDTALDALVRPGSRPP